MANQKVSIDAELWFKINDAINLLGWDYDRFSTGGAETYDQLAKLAEEFNRKTFGKKAEK